MFGDKEQRLGGRQEIEPTPGVEFVISDTDIGPDFDDLLRAILAKVLQYDHRLEPVMTITSTGDVQSRAVLEAYVHRVMGIKGVPIVPGEVTGRRLDEVNHTKLSNLIGRKLLQRVKPSIRLRII